MMEKMQNSESLPKFSIIHFQFSIRLAKRGAYALFGLAFAPAPAKTALASPLRTNSLVHYAKGTPSSLAGLRLLGRITFQGLFHPPFGVLFTVPSRYYPLSISALF